MAMLRKFQKSDRGTAAVEFALVVLVFFILFFVVIEFARLWWTWNMANQATQAGVRWAIVSDPISNNMKTFDAMASGLVVGNGATVPIGDIADATCTANACNFGAGDTVDAAAFQTILRPMQRMYPAIQAANVRVIYRHVGLGFAGNPYGMDFTPSITIELTGLTFEPLFGGLLGMGTINMPLFSSTLTGEDMAS